MSKRSSRKCTGKRHNFNRQTLAAAIREFLTPEAFKQVRKQTSRRKLPRWDIHPLIYVALLMTWCSGDSLPEQFEAARAAYVVCCPSKKRPGKTSSGFEKALCRLPMPVLRCVAASLRREIFQKFGERMFYKGWIPLGCDGTTIDVPRTEELEQRLGEATKKGSGPKLYLSAVVHLTLGIPWCWRWGRGGKSSEREHLSHLVKHLPAAALLVADAGYMGYEVMRGLMNKNVSFLIRMSSQATFNVEGGVDGQFREGRVWYWPSSICDRTHPPLEGRLIRVRNRRYKHDVWLFTNVPREKLTRKMAARFYRLRWENECFFRTYKRTLKTVKLRSRTLRMVHREAEASMLATQLLHCLGALAMPAGLTAGLPTMCSPRAILVLIRKALNGRRLLKKFTASLATAIRERRKRKTAKEKREWPGRAKHTPPKPPKLRTLSDEHKLKLQTYFQAV